jgi:hypothetical protein
VSDRRQTRTVEPADPRDPEPGPDADAAWTFPRLASPDSQEGSPPGRAFSRRKLVRLAAVALGLGVLAIAAIGFGRVAVDWLHQRPEYLISFRDIELEPEPPPYIRLGKAKLLERIRERAGLPERLSILSADPADLARIFPLHSPWIEQVDGIRKQYPNRLVIRLTYREPVGKTTGPNGAPIFLAPSGAARGDGTDRPPLAVVLDGSEIDESACGPLFRIEDLGGAVEDRPGLSVAPSGDEETNARAVAAVSLAAFLQNKIAERPRGPEQFQVLGITAVQGKQGLNLYLKVDSDVDGQEDGWVLWRKATLEDESAHLTDEQKWQQLQQWFGKPGRPGPRGPHQYLDFTPDGPRLFGNRPAGESEPTNSRDRSGVSPRPPSH